MNIKLNSYIPLVNYSVRKLLMLTFFIYLHILIILIVLVLKVFNNSNFL